MGTHPSMINGLKMSCTPRFQVRSEKTSWSTRDVVYRASNCRWDEKVSSSRIWRYVKICTPIGCTSCPLSQPTVLLGTWELIDQKGSSLIPMQRKPKQWLSLHSTPPQHRWLSKSLSAPWANLKSMCSPDQDSVANLAELLIPASQLDWACALTGWGLAVRKIYIYRCLAAPHKTSPLCTWHTQVTSME